jgi:hypothetical protein
MSLSRSQQGRLLAALFLKQPSIPCCSFKRLLLRPNCRGERLLVHRPSSCRVAVFIRVTGDIMLPALRRHRLCLVRQTVKKRSA